MISTKLVNQADADIFMESETLSTTTESSFENQSGRDRGRTEPGKKMKKLRSIKLSRVPSTRKGRSSSSQFRTLLSGYAASSEQFTPIDMSDTSPNHINARSPSDAKAQNFQGLPPTLTRRSSFKPARTVTRRSSMKLRRSQVRKSSGGTDLKKATSSSDMKKEQLQASPGPSESSFDSSDQDKKISTNEKLKLAYPGDKSIRARTSTLGPMRILTKMPSLKSKRPSTKKCSEISSISDPSIERATCSSTLKDSKFPDPVEIKPEGSESDGNAVLNVCRYSYCSLHGHNHGNKPPLKRFVSMRRRMAKTQKSLKPERQSSGKAKHSGNRKKGIQNGGLQQRSVDIKEILSVPGKDQRAPADEEADRDVNEDKASSLNSEECNGDLGKEVKKLETVSTGGSFELSGGLFSSASVSGIVEEPRLADEEKNKDSELDHGILQPADSMAATTADVACKTEMENQKNFTFWKLIYQHMVTGLDAEHETQKPLPGVRSKEQVENLHNACENDSCQDISQTDQAMSIEDQEANNRKLEFSQSDAVKLVQQAFDKILSEIPDHSYDDQSVASETISKGDFLLKKQDEGKEASISNSSISIEDCTVQDQEEMKLQTDNKTASEELKAAQMEGKKSDKQMPSSWSNLKKIIILNRFVKSLEKVRNLKPRKPRYLPMNKDPEAEKIHLRHQNMKGKKNTEEWMLDHALRQVISTLAPSQKKKVAMLVQAFETVIPLPENENDISSNAAASSPTTSVQANNESSIHNCDIAQKENGPEILPGKSLYPEMSVKDNQDQVNECQRAHHQIQKTPHEPKETSLFCGCSEGSLCMAASEMSGTDMKKEDTGAVNDLSLCMAASEMSGTDMKKEDTGAVNDLSLCMAASEVSIVMDVQPKLVDLSLSEHEEHGLSDKSLNNDDVVRTSQEKFFPENEEVIQRVSKGEIPILESGVRDGGSEFVQKTGSDSSDLINSADQHPSKPESQREVGEAQPKQKFLSSPHAQSESNFAANVSKSERQKYMRLWYLIYKHMVSGSATEDGSQPLHRGADEEVNSDNASEVSRENNADCQGSFAVAQDMMQNYTTGSQYIECHNNEIIKLVEEAIDEIPLPETQDDTSDNQSVTADGILDQELSEKKHGEEGHIISSSTGSAKEDSEEARNIAAELHSTLNFEEKILNSENVSSQKEAKGKTKEGSASKKRVQRNWSNLKKLILLRRFVKALDKVREFNLRPPQYLPLDPAPESEKVLLRHQNMEDRKNGEEWMLDYALQKVVAKLTPERKRRVELLVEAFETVIPTIS